MIYKLGLISVNWPSSWLIGLRLMPELTDATRRLQRLTGRIIYLLVYIGHFEVWSTGCAVFIQVLYKSDYLEINTNNKMVYTTKKRTYSQSCGEYEYECKRPRINTRPLPFKFNPQRRYFQQKLTFDHFVADFVSDTDLFNESSIMYDNLLSTSSYSFQDKHIVWNHYTRKQLLKFCKKLLCGNMSYNEDILYSNRFLTELWYALGPIARMRFDEMITYGSFSTGQYRCRTNSIILSKREGIVLHLARLSNSMFDFNLKIEVNPLLSRHLGKNYYRQINHYSRYRLY